MDFEKVAHDITISMLPRALDNTESEWVKTEQGILKFNHQSVVYQYNAIYQQVYRELMQQMK